MMLDRVPQLKSEVFPFYITSGDEQIYFAAPTLDSRTAWLQTIANFFDSPRSAHNSDQAAEVDNSYPLESLTPSSPCVPLLFVDSR